MFKYLKKILKKNLSETNYKRILYIVNIYKNSIFYINLFFSVSIKKNYKNINNNLIIISQIQRSGGTLLSQLFDNHPEIHSYPSELKLTNPKFDWTKKMNFTTFFNDPLLVSSAKYNNYKKDGSGTKKNLGNINEFKFDFLMQKKIFENQKHSNNLRKNLNAYFTSFFHSFKNYKNNNGRKKYVVSFIPRFILKNENLNIFFKCFEKGKIICIIRSPSSWLASCINHSEEYKRNPLNTLMLWKMNALMTIKAKKKYKENVIIVDFNDLINNTKTTMKKICKTIKINYSDNLIKPSFNGMKIRSNSSFESSFGKIDQKTLSRQIKKNYLKQCKAMIFECNYIKEDILKFKI